MRALLCLLTAFGALVGATPGIAQPSFPERGRPITMIIPYPPGGGNDITGRLLVPELERALGTSIVVMNRAGAGSQIGMQQLAEARPDGYTIAYGLWPSTITLYLTPGRTAPFTRDSFAPLAMHIIDPGVLVVPQPRPFQSFADLLAAARARPGVISMADAGILGWEHLASSQLQWSLGIELNQVHYAGGGGVARAILSNEIDATMMTTSFALPLIRDGQVRPLAMLAPQRSAMLPDVPTMAEAGMALAAGSARGFVAPAGTPEPILRRLAEALDTAINSEAHRAQLQRIGLAPTFLGRAEFAAYWRSEEDRLRPILQELARRGQNN